MAGAKHPNMRSQPAGTEREISWSAQRRTRRHFAQDRMGGWDVKGIGDGAQGGDYAGLSLSEGGTWNPISGNLKGLPQKGGRLRRWKGVDLRRGTRGRRVAFYTVAEHHGHSTTIQRKSKENPADRVCDRRYPVSRGVTYGLRGCGRRRTGRPRHDLAGRSETRPMPAKCAGWGRWYRRYSLDSSADGLPSGPLGIASGLSSSQIPSLWNWVTRLCSETRWTRIPAQRRGSGVCEPASASQQRTDEQKRTKAPCAVITSRPTCNMM